MYEFQEETCKFIWDRKKNDVRSTRENRPPFAAGPIVDLQQQTTAGRRKHKLLLHPESNPPHALRIFEGLGLAPPTVTVGCLFTNVLTPRGSKEG